MMILIEGKTYLIEGIKLKHLGSRDNGELVVFENEQGEHITIPLIDLFDKEINKVEKIDNDKFKCDCGGGLQVVQEVSGSFTFDVNDDGKFDWNDSEFYGDMNEYVACKKCEKVVDAITHPEGYIEFVI